MMALPLLLDGAENATLTWPLPAVATTAVGAPGAPAGVTVFDTAEGAPGPIALVAKTVQLTATPLANPPTVIGETPPPPLWAPQVAV